MARIGVIYYSRYGSTYELARMLAEGVAQAGGDAHLRRVPDQLRPEDAAEMEGIAEAIERQAHVQEASVEELPGFDGFLIGSPTRYGSAVAHLQDLLDQTGSPWMEGKLVGKPVGLFVGAASRHEDHEATVLGMSAFAYHHGMVIVPVGYGLAPEVGSRRTGGAPCGATHLTPMRDANGLSQDEREVVLAHAAQVNRVADLLVTAA